MPIVDKNGRVITEQEFNDLVNMMTEQYSNLKPEVMKIHSDAVCQSFMKGYEQRISTLKDDYLQLMNDNKNIYIDSILQNELAGTTKNIVENTFDMDVIKRINEDYRNASKSDRRYYDNFVAYAEIFLKGFGSLDILNIIAPDDAKNSGLGQQDQSDAFEKTVKPFELAKKPMQGVEGIINYNPNSDSASGILNQRAGNSNTLFWDEKNVAEGKAKLKKELDEGKIFQQDYNTGIENIDKFSTARNESMFSFGSASSLTRMHASQLMNKDAVNYSDIFNAFSEINAFVNMNNKDNPNPGTLRGGNVHVGDSIFGVSIGNVASDMYKTTQMIADYINDIKAEPNPALQKTQAIQLAAFTYQMTLSEHLFSDGNGRSCRMLADTILQTFGLPPHMPMPDETSIAATLGTELDFNKGAEIYFEGVKQSSDALRDLKKDDPQKKSTSGEKAKGREYIKTEVTKELVDNISALKENSIKAKGLFSNSPQYKKFLDSFDVYESFAKAIADAQEKNLTTINTEMLSPSAKDLVAAIKQGAELGLTDAKRMFNQSASDLRQRAKDYVDYKLADHTFDKSAEPNKKALNSDDIKKLSIMGNILGKDFETGKELSDPLDSVPMEFPAAVNYVPENTEQNLLDRKELLKQISTAIFGDENIHKFMRNADGSRIWYGKHELKTTDKLSKTQNQQEEIIATLNDEPHTKFQIYWPKDNSMHWLSFNPETLRYSVSQDSIPVPADEAKLVRYNETITAVKDDYSKAKLPKDEAIQNINKALADTENADRIAKDATRIFNEENAGMSELWFNALSDNPAFKSKDSPEAQFVNSCNDKTAHGRTRIYEFAVGECIKAYTENQTKETQQYFSELKEALPQMIKSMKRDGYEPVTADFKELGNLIKNSEKARSMMEKSFNELPGLKGTKAVDKLCEIVYINAFKQKNGMLDPREFEEALDAKTISNSVSQMSKAMTVVVQNEGAALVQEMKGKSIEMVGGLLASKISDVVNSVVKVQQKKAEIIENSGPVI